MTLHTVLGINRTQDASICLLQSDGKAIALQKERLTRHKHDWGRCGDLSSFYMPKLGSLTESVDTVVECYSSDPELQNRADYRDELTLCLNHVAEKSRKEISHHLAHLYSCIFPSGFAECAVMIIDCAGSYITSVTEPFAFPPSMPSNTVEVASYYDCEADSMHCVAKQTWRMDWQDPQGLGAFYHLLTRRIFPGEGNEGKVMALASYGDPDALGLPPLATKHGMVLIPEPWRCLIASGDNYRFIEDDAAALKRCANFAAAGQRCFEKALLEVAGWLRKCTGKQNLCFAGGTALNCTANAKLLREAGFRDVYIPPAPHDGGTAVGCALYGLALLEGPNACRRFSWTNDYLGVPESQDDVSSIVRRYGNVEMVKPLNLSFEVAQLLANGLVVGLFQQRAEFGPRALGNRSILADPRNPGIRNWINEQVKGRELFRPLAPTVLAERAAEYFCVPCASPFMQYAVAVRPEVESAIRGVVHRDGSARIQTLEECINPLFYKIIDEFARLTGVPMVLNTSLNRKEEPIVETVNEAMACLTGSGMHALAIPPYLIKKRFIATNAQCSNE